MPKPTTKNASSTGYESALNLRDLTRVTGGSDLKSLPGVSELSALLNDELLQYVSFAQHKLWMARYCSHRLSLCEQATPNQDTAEWGAVLPLDTYTIAGLGLAWSALDSLAVAIVGVHALGVGRRRATFMALASADKSPAVVAWRKDAASGRIIAAFVSTHEGKHLHELRTESFHHYISTAYAVQLEVDQSPRSRSLLPEPGSPGKVNVDPSSAIELGTFVGAVENLINEVCGALAAEIRQTKESRAAESRDSPD